MTMELLTAGYLAVTIFYAWATFKIMQANQRTLNALHDQTDALLRPYVSISAVTLPNNVIFYLRIANTGKTGAENLRLTLIAISSSTGSGRGRTSEPFRRFSSRSSSYHLARRSPSVWRKGS